MLAPWHILSNYYRNICQNEKLLTSNIVQLFTIIIFLFYFWIICNFTFLTQICWRENDLPYVCKLWACSYLKQYVRSQHNSDNCTYLLLACVILIPFCCDLLWWYAECGTVRVPMWKWPDVTHQKTYAETSDVGAVQFS